MSVHFNIPFNGLCQGMQVMHRAGFSVTALNTDYAKSEPQATTSKSKLKEKSVELSPAKSSSPKNTELKSENKAESTKSDKKSSQRNRRQRRK